MAPRIDFFQREHLFVSGKRKTQKTTPKKGDPVEIPVPKRKQVEDLLRRAALKRTSTSR